MEPFLTGFLMQDEDSEYRQFARLAGLAMAAQAQMRCGTELISDGDLKPRVLATCGPPYAMLGEEDLVLGNERWVYNFGPDEFLMVVEFNGDEVRRIESDGYGFVEPRRRPLEALEDDEEYIP